MGKILSFIMQDFKLLLRNAIFWVITGSLAVIVLTVRFLIPGDFNANARSIVSYNLETEIPSIASLDSEQSVLDAVKKGGAVGFIRNGESISLVHPGLSQKAQNALMKTIFGESSGMNIKINRIRESPMRIPENIRLTPVFICFEALVSGFLMAGILLLEEKEEGTIKACRISPAGTVEYVTAKVLLFSILGTVYSILMAVMIAGFGFNWGGFILLAFLSGALFTLLGLSITVFFKDMSSWFSISILVLTINILTMFSFSSPSFSPGWIRLIPSYPILFAFEDLLFGGGRGIAEAVLTVFAEVVVLYVITCILIRKRLLQRERRFI